MPYSCVVEGRWAHEPCVGRFSLRDFGRKSLGTPSSRVWLWAHPRQRTVFAGFCVQKSTYKHRLLGLWAQEHCVCRFLRAKEPCVYRYGVGACGAKKLGFCGFLCAKEPCVCGCVCAKESCICESFRAKELCVYTHIHIHTTHITTVSPKCIKIHSRDSFCGSFRTKELCLYKHTSTWDSAFVSLLEPLLLLWVPSE